jgi:glycosyltransferase involved in cell wall biosynthesis
MNFSIITCTWNSEKFLPSTIESVLSQSHNNFELVFVDGGSGDATLTQIERVNCKKIVLHNVRGGIAHAMNAGIEAARGDVVIHLHSDDYLLHSDVLLRVAEVFERTNCEWLFGRILNDRDGGLFPETYQSPEYSYKALQRSNFVPHAATFVRRSLYQRAGGFSESLRYAMDYEMWLRLGRLAEPVQMREALSVFRRHGGSTTEKNRLASFDEDHAVRLRYLGANPLDNIRHALRHQVRRRRLVAQLQAQAYAPEFSL